MAYFITASTSASVTQTTFDTTGSIITSSLFTPNDPLNVDNITTIKKSRSPYPNLNRPIYKESVSFTDNNGTDVNWLYDNTASRDTDFNLIKTLNTNYEKSGGGGSIDTGSFATTGSNTFVGNQIITGSLTLHGSGTASPTLNFENDGASTPLAQIKGQSYGGGSGGGLNFYYYNGSNIEGFQLNNSGKVGIGNSDPPKKLTVEGSISASGDLMIDGELQVNNRLLETSSLSSAGNISGDIIKSGNNTTVAGLMYVLTGSKSGGSGWILATSGSGVLASSSLAVALGTNSTTNGMLLRGTVNVGHDPGDANAIGGPLYLADNGSSSYQATTTATHIVRVIGHYYSTNIINFNPSNDWIVRS